MTRSKSQFKARTAPVTFSEKWLCVNHVWCHTLAGRPVSGAPVALRTNAHIGPVRVHTLSSREAEISFQTLVNV